MNEIEIKIKFENLKAVVQKIEALGCKLSKPQIQKDVIFVSTAMKEYKVVKGTVILRTRDENGKSTFTLKKQSKVNLSSKEFNLEIEDSETLHKMLSLMGFRELVKVTKTRRKGKLGKYTICIDEVERLGNFIELEYITERTDYNNVQTEMLLFLKNLGIDTKNQVFTPYDTQIFRLDNSSNIL